MTLYRHRQSSRLMPAVALVLVVAVVFGALSAQRPAAFISMSIAALIAIALTFGFSSLTVEVDEDKLVWFFGPGIWKKHIALGDIASAAAVRNPWWYGFGIHRTPRGWLYNVGGLDAVEIALACGRTLRIGTDEPEALAAALKRR